MDRQSCTTDTVYQAALSTVFSETKQKAKPQFLVVDIDEGGRKKRVSSSSKEKLAAVSSCRRSHKPTIKEKNAAPRRTTNKTVTGCICCELFGVTACSPSLPLLENNGKMLETQELLPDWWLLPPSFGRKERAAQRSQTGWGSSGVAAKKLCFYIWIHKYTWNTWSIWYTNIWYTYEIHDIFWTLPGGLSSWWATQTRIKTLQSSYMFGIHSMAIKYFFLLWVSTLIVYL